MVFDPYKDKIKERRRRQAEDHYGLSRSEFKTEEDYQNYLGRLYHTAKPCSCEGCGNPRHHCKGKEKLTLRERKVAQEKELDVE